MMDSRTVAAGCALVALALLAVVGAGCASGGSAGDAGDGRDLDGLYPTFKTPVAAVTEAGLTPY